MANETPVIQGELRTEFGKGAARRLRRDRRLPGVLYASHIDPIHFHIDLLEAHSLVRQNGVNAVFELELDGERHLAMVKVIDQNILTLDFDHLDVLNIKRGEKVEVSVNVVTVGEVYSGAMLIQEEDTILVEAPVLSIPEELEVNVEGMEAGSQVLAGQIELPDEVILVDDPEMMVLNITEEEVAEIPDDEEIESTAEGVEDAPEGESPDDSTGPTSD